MTYQGSFLNFHNNNKLSCDYPVSVRKLEWSHPTCLFTHFKRHDNFFICTIYSLTPQVCTSNVRIYLRSLRLRKNLKVTDLHKSAELCRIVADSFISFRFVRSLREIISRLIKRRKRKSQPFPSTKFSMTTS